MGAPLPPEAFIPMTWAMKAEMRALPGDPGMESETAYWVEELGAWIAEDDEEETLIRKAVGELAIVLRGKDLNP